MQRLLCKTTTYIILGLSLFGGLAHGAGPDRDETFAFIQSRFLEQGRGHQMVVEGREKIIYYRYRPDSLTLNRSNQLVLSQFIDSMTRSERLSLIQLEAAMGESTLQTSPIQYQLKLHDLDPGRISLRNGDWGAARSYQTETGKIRLTCTGYLRCIQSSAGKKEKYLDLYIDNQRDREKLAKAMEHLITQAQRREDLF